MVFSGERGSSIDKDWQCLQPSVACGSAGSLWWLMMALDCKK